MTIATTTRCPCCGEPRSVDPRDGFVYCYRSRRVFVVSTTTEEVRMMALTVDEVGVLTSIVVDLVTDGGVLAAEHGPAALHTLAAAGLIVDLGPLGGPGGPYEVSHAGRCQLRARQLTGGPGAV